MCPKYIGDIILSPDATIEDKLGKKCGKHMLKRENMVLKTAYFLSI